MNAPCRIDWPVGRGHRSPETLLRIDKRNQVIREIADRYFADQSIRSAAGEIRRRLARFREGSWRRDRTAASCPERHRGRLEALLWEILRVHDAVPCEESLRKILGRL